MKKKIMIVLFMILIFFTLLFHSCKKRNNNQGKIYSGKFVLCILKTLDNQYFTEMKEGLQQATDKSGFGYSLKIRSGTSEGDSDGQRQIMDTFFIEEVLDKPNPKLIALIITPCSSGDPLVGSIKAYREARIPVIIVDTPIKQESLNKQNTNITCFIASNNKNGAKKAAQEINSRTKKGDKILLLNGLDGHETATLRKDGFYEGIRKDVNVIPKTCDWERLKAKSTVETLLSVGTRFDAVFAANDQMAIGAIEAFKQAKINPSNITIIGFDAIKEAKRLVDDGVLYATMEQKPSLMGEQAIVIVDNFLSGSSIPEEIPIEVEIYKKK